MDSKVLITLVLFFGVLNAYKLPTDLIPDHYNVKILTVLEEFKFNGSVEIYVKCFEPTSNIILHSKNLTIFENQTEIKDRKDASKIRKVSKFSYDKNDLTTISLESSLEKGESYVIVLFFEGALTDSLSGFYRSSYKNEHTNGKEWLAVTQFEPISAREAFPCFDEPMMKATFNITLGRKAPFTSLSNMPLISSEPIQGMDKYFWDKFENSVPMSTYLVAFLVSDFDYKEADLAKTYPTGNASRFRIWARKTAGDQLDFAVNFGPKALKFYEDYFDIKYPLPKMDMVAIPDFSAGAMENWGLITYRETALLYDPNKSSSTSQFYVASVIAHELAHQWFGNLVTMKWWTDLWLNEGFATYMAAVAVDKINPQWNSLKEETYKNAISVFELDALKTSHPISVTIQNPNLISEIFDTISYEKGSFVIRMMGYFLGEETLRKGVANYLNKNKYKNADQDDLWESLTAQATLDKVLPANLTVKAIMDTWTLQTGYPVIQVTRNYKDNTATIKQHRFVKDYVKEKTDDEKYFWHIPLSYTSQEKKDFNTTTPKQWFSGTPQEELIIKDIATEKEWVIFNIQLANLYKVNYDEANWQLLIKHLNSEHYDEIAPLNRIQLIEDAFDLAFVGDIKYDIVFELAKYLKYETDYIAWKSGINNVNFLKKHLRSDEESFGYLKKYMQNILSPAYDKIGGLKLRTKETALDTIKHQLFIIKYACAYEVPKCVQDATNIFQAWKQIRKLKSNETNPILNELRGVIYRTALKEGTEEDWNLVWEQYLISNSADEKSTILRSLGSTQNDELLRKYLEMSLDENSGIRRQDTSVVFNAVVSQKKGFPVAKDFFYKNVKTIKEYRKDFKSLTRYLKALSTYIITDKDNAEFLKFIESNAESLSEIKQGVKQAIERAKLNVQWQNSHNAEVKTILKQLTEK